jgi:hypothetical protein
MSLSAPRRIAVKDASLRIMRLSAVVWMVCVLMAGCRLQKVPAKPSLEFTHVPPASDGGPERMDSIEGRASGTTPGQQVVLYAKTDVWWVQPTGIQPFTPIQGDSTWKTSIHLGTEYAALLVEPGYHPPPKLTELPKEGNGVAAIVTSKGGVATSDVLKTIHFSGYDWVVRSAPSNRGGETNLYETANAWTDDKGHLHLQMGQRNGHWSCAEVNLTRSLGYGTYKFVVQDSAHLSSSAVLGLFTTDERLSEINRPELDIELSQWGKAADKNAQYVVQPYFIPQNITRFDVPVGVLTHILHWEPGSAGFKTVKGAAAGAGAKSIGEHMFTSGIPVAAAETIHMGFYDFYHSKSTSQRSAEVVIEKFEYLP